MPTGETTTLPVLRPEGALALEPRFAVLIHNDDVTTFDYVIGILGGIFALSVELAEHIAWIAHTDGQAIVTVRPRSEADKLRKAANNRARTDGFPLTFTIEPEE